MISRDRTIFFSLGVALLGLITLTVPFWIWPLDLTVQSRFYDPDDGWFQEKSPIWTALYHFGTLPAILFVLGSLLVFTLSFRLPRFVPWRKLSAYFVLCMVLGPGLLVNTGFKDNWGRPRPRDVENFGGNYNHEKVWHYDATSPGKSFPCGHCSMGFYFLAVALVAGRWRWAVLISGVSVLYGAAIGGARIAMGGHFLSDVLWAGGFCLLASLGLFFGLRLDRSIRYEPKPDASLRLPPIVVIGTSSLAIAAVLFVVLATPYQRDERFHPDFSDAARFEISLILEGDEHLVRLSDEMTELRSLGNGFGIPGSAIKIRTREEKAADEHYFQLKQRRSGWFSELKQRNEMVLPRSQPGFVRIVVKSGRLNLQLENLAAAQTWRIETDNPEEVVLSKPDSPLDLEIHPPR